MPDVLCMSRRWLAGAVAAAALIGAPRALAAQLPADASWRTISSTHFRVTYEADLEPLARHAAESAERAHAALSLLVADAPDGTIDLVVADNIDISNGYATPFPSNRIVIYAKPPVDVLELQYTRDWIEMVVTHELAHIFHLDVTSGFGELIRTIFGRIPAPWPVFPAAGTPLWSIEGLAVGVESAVTGFGRVHGSYNEMVVRTAALAGDLDEYDRLGSSSARWPGPSRSYIYGSLFTDYLARRFGPDASARVVRSIAGAVIPPPLWFGRVGTNALGMTFRDAYRDWLREVSARSDSVAAILRGQGLTRGTPLTQHRAIAQHPRFSPDGNRIAYAAHDWRTPPEQRVIDAVTGAEEWTSRQNQPGPSGWLTRDRLVTGDVEFVDRFRIFGDLHFTGDRDDRITHGARLQEPDAARDGRIVAVQNEDGTNRLVIVDAQSGEIRPLNDFDADVHWSLPRFSPDGSRIAVGRWSRGGAYDIVIIDTLDAMLRVTDGIGINAAPAWSPDGRWLLFSSDRSGVPNIYAADMTSFTAGSRAPAVLRQVTNVLTGAFHPDVSSDGRLIAMSLYHDDGFRIETLPFDTAQWRTPAAAGFASALAPRVEYADDAEDSEFLDSVSVAFESADVATGEPREYSAFRSLLPRFWLPVFETGVIPDQTYIGVWTAGSDLVERHAWDASLLVEPGSGRTQGFAGYTYRGLPTIPGIGLHPTLSAHVERDQDIYIRRRAPGELYADEREDLAALSLNLTRSRWRSSSGLGVSGERVRRSRHLYDAPDSLSLIDPKDDMWGIRAHAFTAHFLSAPLSISRENGYTLQVAARQRWERDVRTVVRPEGTLVLDASYRELTTWNAGYVALPLPGFARHVLALRFSGLLRDGIGSPLTSIGGATGSGFRVPGLNYDVGSSSTLLPVRGFERGVRIGNAAWTASAEYRMPIALIDAPLRPFFFDRVSGALFADAGDAWCTDDITTRYAACSEVNGAQPLISLGAELTVLVGFLGFSTPLRFGGAMPVSATSDRKPRFYILTGPSF